MFIISYDISDDKLRTQFMKSLMKQGAIRLQYSVYEFNYPKRALDNLIVKIENYWMKKFEGSDSVVVFNVSNDNVFKYGNAIHRDKDLLFFD